MRDARIAQPGARQSTTSSTRFKTHKINASRRRSYRGHRIFCSEGHVLLSASYLDCSLQETHFNTENMVHSPLKTTSCKRNASATIPARQLSNDSAWINKGEFHCFQKSLLRTFASVRVEALRCALSACAADSRGAGGLSVQRVQIAHTCFSNCTGVESLLRGAEWVR